MITIAICDDNSQSRLDVCRAIKETGILADIDFNYFENGKELLESYENGRKYDIVFLDVDMPHISGIEAGKTISEIDSRAIIIFVTNYPQYAIDSFDCNAFHYLLKNTSKEKLKSVLSKALDKYKAYHQTLALSTNMGTVKIHVSDIYYVECFKKHLYYHTRSDTYITSQTLTEGCEMLSAFGFFKVHQGYIVNFDKVSSIIGNDITMENGKSVPVSTRKRTEVIRAYTEYLKGCI